ncbi:MAG: hypothetical protein WBB82_01830 [Limnothrix sp.]
MPRPIRTLTSGVQLIFDTGNRDTWCVYIVDLSNNQRIAPLDIHLFANLKRFAETYEVEKVYEDFQSIYDATDSEVSNEVFEVIDQIVLTYSEVDQRLVDLTFHTLYACMIAEENKYPGNPNALGKRIKHLGVYQSLVLNYSPQAAADYSTGKNRVDLDPEMRRYGF